MWWMITLYMFFFFQAEDGIRDVAVTGVQTCALPIYCWSSAGARPAIDDAGNVRDGHQGRGPDSAVLERRKDRLVRRRGRRQNRSHSGIDSQRRDAARRR